MTYNTEGRKIQWVETDQETKQMIELVSRSIKSYNYIPYVQEAREKTEYVKERHGRCKKIEIKLLEMKSTMSEINRNNGWKISEFDKSYQRVHLRSSANPAHVKYEEITRHNRAHYNEIVLNQQ